MPQKTIFQKIIDRELPATVRYEDERCIVIEDISPQAPVHLLVIPKKPIPRLAQLEAQDAELMGYLFTVIQRLSISLGLEEGFRIVINNGPKAGETVPHLHIHLLGGRVLDWPPG